LLPIHRLTCSSSACPTGSLSTRPASTAHGARSRPAGSRPTSPIHEIFHVDRLWRNGHITTIEAVACDFMLSLCCCLCAIAYKSLLTISLRGASVLGMALARARGCAGSRLRLRSPARQADASRRLNGPRKATSCRLITVRLRSKSCLSWGHRVSRVGRRAVVAIVAANPSAGGCGVENQVGRASAVQDTQTGRGL
jgi:hypothetical protein